MVEVGKAAFAKDLKEIIDKVVATNKWRNETKKSGIVGWMEDCIDDAM